MRGLDAVARPLAVLLLAAALPAGPALAKQLQVVGRIATQDGGPAGGFTVRWTNRPASEGTFATKTRRDGSFVLTLPKVTENIDFDVDAGPYYLPIHLHDFPEPGPQRRKLFFYVEAIPVEVSGRVLIADGNQRTPVADATLTAQVDGRSVLLDVSGTDGRLIVGPLPMRELGGAKRATLTVALPPSESLGGHFAPGEKQTLEVRYVAGEARLGDVVFRRLRDPDSTVHLEGRFFTWDELDRTHTKPINGLELEAVSVSTGRVVAATLTRDGAWSMNLPQGIYRLRSPNSRTLGVDWQDGRPLRLDFGRRIETGLRRFRPKIMEVKAKRLVLTYPRLPGLPIQEVVLRKLEGGVARHVPFKRKGARVEVRLSGGLRSSEISGVAVRVDDLLTGFATGLASGGGAP